MFEWLFACKAEPWDPRVMSLSLMDFVVPYVLLDVFMFRVVGKLISSCPGLQIPFTLLIPLCISCTRLKSVCVVMLRVIH